MCCSALQCAAVCCSVLQCVAGGVMCVSLKKLVDVHSHVVQRTAAHCSTWQHTAAHCNTLQHTATYCDTLRHTATHRNTLQHTATHCSTLTYVTGRIHRWCGWMERKRRSSSCAAIRNSNKSLIYACCSVLQRVAACCSVLQSLSITQIRP